MIWFAKREKILSLWCFWNILNFQKILYAVWLHCFAVVFLQLLVLEGWRDLPFILSCSKATRIEVKRLISLFFFFFPLSFASEIFLKFCFIFLPTFAFWRWLQESLESLVFNFCLAVFLMCSKAYLNVSCRRGKLQFSDARVDAGVEFFVL